MSNDLINPAAPVIPVTPSLVSKLTQVMAVVERVPKRGRNEFHRYDYATEADIAAVIRAELAARNVMLFPSIVGESRSPVGEKGVHLTTLDMVMEFVDGDSGERIAKPWKGYGSDKDDKGGYKAMTGGEKYFLLKTFLIPTGDDPEQDTERPASAAKVAAAAMREKTVEKLTAPEGYESWLLDLHAVARNGLNEMRETYRVAKPEYRQYLESTEKATLDTLVAKATEVDAQPVEAPAPKKTKKGAAA